MGNKNADKEKSRVPLFSLDPEWRNRFCVIISIFGIIVVVATICQKWDKGWLKILKSLGTNIPASVFTVGLLFVITESSIDANQRRLERRKARNRNLAEKIRGEIARGVRNPQSFDDEVENQAFRLLEKHRPPFFSRIRRRKSSEYNKMIAKGIRCMMQSKRDDIFDSYAAEIEERAFRALEKNRPKSLFCFFKRRKR